MRVDGGAFSHVLVPEMLRDSSLSSRDRAFVTEHVYGTLRWRRRLDDMLDRVASRPVTDLDPPVRAAVRLGAHQLMSGVAAHAAVAETVEAVGTPARGFVNAVLRRLAELAQPWPEPQGPHALGIETSHPDWIVDRLVAEWGAVEARRVLDADNEAPPVTLRIRGGARSAADVAASLRVEHGATVTTGNVVPSALLVRGGDPSAWTALRSGAATVQDQASQAVVQVVAPQPGERVVDVAAAPGGKATAVAELVNGDGLAVACDLHMGRLRRVREARDRIGLHGVLAEVAADGRHLPLASAADAVLVDAPCSGLGVLRRRPEARWRVEPRDIAEFAALQRALLAEAAGVLRPGGRLVYSVCTWAREETVEVAEWAAVNLAGFSAEPISGPWRERGPGGQLLASDGCDGMFVLRLQRTT